MSPVSNSNIYKIQANNINVFNDVYINNSEYTPVGSILTFAGINVPSGWLFCNGSEVAQSDYPRLFSVIGNLYGTPANNNNFILPNLADRIPVGKTNSNSLGNSGGNSSITLSVSQLPSHTHTGTSDVSGTHLHTGTSDVSGLHLHTGTSDVSGTHLHTGTSDVSGTHLHTGTSDVSGTHLHRGTSDISGTHLHTGTTHENGTHTHTGTSDANGTHTHSIYDPGHTHTQTTINDDFNSSGGSPPGFVGDSAGSKTWTNINSSTTGISINSSGSHAHTFTSETAGSHAHTFTSETAGSHAHTFTSETAGNHAHTFTSETAGNHAHTFTTQTAGSHAHTFTTNATGSGTNIDIRNKYIVLNYIIRY